MAGNLSKSNDLGIGKTIWLKIITTTGVIFLFAPIIVLIAYSFNSSRAVTNWENFSFNWYDVAFQDKSLWVGVKNSLIIAFLSSIISTILGTMLALALSKYTFRGRKFLQNLIYIPIILPEIIFGIALLSIFIMINLPLGLLTITIAHATFSMSFVAIIVSAKFRNFDKNLEEASLDLGATRLQTFFKVVLPVISPGIISGALFSFTLSIDDFVTTFFTSGVGSSTLPLKIYSLIKYGITPEINAISTILIVFTITALLIAALIQKSSPKTVRFIFIGFIIVFGSLLGYSYVGSDDSNTLNICNYTEYLDAALIKDFEKEYNIKVNYDFTNGSNETLAKLQIGNPGYDIVVPSDYAVELMIKKNLLSEIDFSNIPNYKYINEKFKRLEYDTTGKFYIPYTYGFSGIGYNSNVIKEPVDSWKILWDSKYKMKITMIDDWREVFFVAFKLLGYRMEDKNPEHLQNAVDFLLKQKPLLFKYESNLMKDYLISNQVYLTHTWTGEVMRMQKEYPYIKFSAPKEGVLMFIDNMCIPKGAPHKRNAEIFFNYLLEPKNSARNITKILYPMPNKEAFNHLSDSTKKMLSIYPSMDQMVGFDLLKDLGEYTAVMNKAWTEVKNR